MSDRRTAITELLRSIPEPDLEELASHVHRSHHAAHELIFTKRDEGTSVMFVAAGRVKIVSVPRSTERALRCGKARRCDVPLQARRLRLLHWPHRRRRRLPWRCCAR
jgi:hypothetical protein